VVVAGFLNRDEGAAAVRWRLTSRSGPPGCPAADLVSPYLEKKEEFFFNLKK